MAMNRQVPVAYLLVATVIGMGFGQLLGSRTAVAERAAEEKGAKRIGMVIGLKPEQVDAYLKLHADSNPGVRDLLSKANMRNFSIFMRKMDDGKPYLFGYYEYAGDDFDADMAWLSAQPRNKQWLKVTDVMQSPLKGETGWVEMRTVYHND